MTIGICDDEEYQVKLNGLYLKELEAQNGWEMEYHGFKSGKNVMHYLEKKPLDILFLDIETTGFTANSSYLYMIGCAYHQDGNWQIIQWMAENYEQEQDILAAFLEFSADYHCLIHFNGNYHTDSGSGIITYLRQYRPGVRLKTVYSVRQEETKSLEDDYLGRAE